MRFKKGDLVEIAKGEEKGKKAKVIKYFEDIKAYMVGLLTEEEAGYILELPGENLEAYRANENGVERYESI